MGPALSPRLLFSQHPFRRQHLLTLCSSQQAPPRHLAAQVVLKESQITPEPLPEALGSLGERTLDRHLTQSQHRSCRPVAGRASTASNDMSDTADGPDHSPAAPAPAAELPPPTYAATQPQILVTPLPDSASFFWGRTVQGEVYVKGLGQRSRADRGVQKL